MVITLPWYWTAFAFGLVWDLGCQQTFLCSTFSLQVSLHLCTTEGISPRPCCLHSLACSSADEVLCCLSPASILGRDCIPVSQRWGIFIIPASPPWSILSSVKQLIQHEFSCIHDLSCVGVSLLTPAIADLCLSYINMYKFNGIHIYRSGTRSEIWDRPFLGISSAWFVEDTVNMDSIQREGIEWEKKRPKKKTWGTPLLWLRGGRGVSVEY